MREILGTAKNIRSLLSGAKYDVDYFQREYQWQTKHVTELLDDLAEKFLGSHEPAHERSAVEPTPITSWGRSSSASETPRNSSSTVSSGLRPFRCS